MAKEITRCLVCAIIVQAAWAVAGAITLERASIAMVVFCHDPLLDPQFIRLRAPNCAGGEPRIAKSLAAGENPSVRVHRQALSEAGVAEWPGTSTYATPRLVQFAKLQRPGTMPIDGFKCLGHGDQPLPQILS